MATKIEWTDETWNPVVGCTECSPGCLNCYAERMAARQVSMGYARHLKDPDSNEDAWIAYSGAIDPDTGKWNGSVVLRPEVTEQPLRWRSPRRIFVCSMGDLFHPKVPFEFVLKIRGLSMVTPWHTYLILTKRIDRVLLFLEWWHEQWRKNPILWGKDALALEAVENMPTNLEKANQYWLDNFDQSKRGKLDYPIPFPQPNLHLGVSISTQDEDWKIAKLLQIPAAKRFVSIEPMLERIDLMGDVETPGPIFRMTGGQIKPNDVNGPAEWDAWAADIIDQVIIGCESLGGRAGRFQDGFIEAAIDIVGQCKAAGVPVFVKQVPINGKVSHEPKEWPQELRERELIKCK